MRYWALRLQRLNGSPHRVALGVSVGIFAAFIPVVGVQMLLAAALAYLTRGSVLGALAGTFVGTPVTYPLMWIGSYNLGAAMLGRKAAFDADQFRYGAAHLWSMVSAGSHSVLDGTVMLLWPILEPLTVGGVALGLVAGTPSYYIVKRAVTTYQASRRFSAI